jgi:hypothetical protein
MQKLRLFFFGAASFLAFSVWAQQPQRPTSLDPGNGFLPSQTPPTARQKKKGYNRVKAGSRKRTPVRHTAQYEFYERVERAARLRQKMMIEQSKHTKSNFGHRKKPRKRPPHKMRYCYECGIRH